MKQSLAVFIQLFKLNLNKALIYKANFWISFVAMSLWMGIYVIFFEVLFSHVDQVAGWNKGEMLLFLGFYYLVQAMGNIFYRESFEVFGEKVRQGQLDLMLTKPASKHLLLFFEDIRVDHIVDLALTLGLFVYASQDPSLNLSLPFLALGLCFALFANLLFYGLLLILASLTFYFERMETFGSFMWHVTQVSRFPRQIYKGLAAWIFVWIFPIALLTSIPAEVALNKSGIEIWFYFLGISVLFFGIGWFCFSIGLKKYSSAG